MVVFLVDGSYNDWSAWTTCSMSCGGGVKFRHRNCSNPLPMHGGRDCSLIGPATESDSCNSEPCPGWLSHPKLFRCNKVGCIALHCIALHWTALHCTVLYCTVLYCTVLYCTVLYCTVLYCKLYCIALYCIAFYFEVVGVSFESHFRDKQKNETGYNLLTV